MTTPGPGRPVFDAHRFVDTAHQIATETLDVGRLRAAAKQAVEAWFDPERQAGRKNDYQLDRALWDLRFALYSEGGAKRP